MAVKGIMTFPTSYSMSPGAFAVAAEERGFESMWVSEHSHIPTSRESPWPGGAELPQMYYDAMDPFVVLTAAAATTTTLKLGTGVAILPQRDTIQTAKQVASLDVVSGGRFLFGVGGGWNAEEMANHGAPFDRRWRLMREKVEAMKEIWANDVASYDGELVSFDAIAQNPKPLQAPFPPIHVGAAYPGGLRRAVRYADGWMPLMGRGGDALFEAMAAVGPALDEAGRDRSTFELSITGCPPDQGLVDQLIEAGADRIVFGAPPFERDRVLPIMDAAGAITV